MAIIKENTNNKYWKGREEKGSPLTLLVRMKPLVLAQGSAIFHSSCEGKLGIALE